MTPSARRLISLEKSRERGLRAGAAWAAETAEFVQLKRLAAVAAHVRCSDTQAGYRIVNTIFGERLYSNDELAEFRAAFGLDDADAESPDYWLGFVESALEMYERVEI